MAMTSLGNHHVRRFQQLQRPVGNRAIREDAQVTTSGTLGTCSMRAAAHAAAPAGWATAADERPDECLLARFCDHVPPAGPPRRLEVRGLFGRERLWEN